MKAKKFFSVGILLLFVAIFVGREFVRAESLDVSHSKSRLAVLWTSGDSEVAHKVCFMYTNAAKRAGWFDEVLLIIWGPSSRLLAGDKELEAKVKGMMDSGIEVQACVACADLYGVAEKLRSMGIEVKPMGKPLSDMLNGDWKVLTF